MIQTRHQTKKLEGGNFMDQQSPAQQPDASSAALDPTNLPQSNLGLAIIGGAVAALIGAAAWAAVTITTGYQIGFMAIGVGFLVGFVVRHLGKGSTPVFGAVGALLSLAGCVVGNIVAFTGLIARASGQPLLSALSEISVPAIPAMLIGTFSAIDVLFYAIAVYEGYKLSFVAPAAHA